MADKRFYDRSGPFTVAALAKAIKATFANEASEKAALERTIIDVQTLQDAQSDEVSFFHNRKYLNDLQKTNAGCVISSAEFASLIPAHCIALIHSFPYRAYAQIACQFYPTVNQNSISNGAIATSAHIADDVIIEPGVVIKPHAVIGSGSVIGANTVIEKGVIIGNHCHIGPNVTLSHCVIGNRACILSGTRIGQPGFGFYMDANGHINVPQLGRVLIENHVEIGANVTIDRGTLEDTIIGSGTRIDNLVQIGHGVRIGRNCVIVAQVGIAGSTHLGDFVVLAGQVGLAGHLKVGDGARIAAQSGVMRDVKPGEVLAGYPAMPAKQWHRQTVTLANLIKKKSQ